MAAANHDPLSDCELLVLSAYGALLIDTPEEERATQLVEQLAIRLQLPLYVWRRGTGLNRTGSSSPVYETEDPRAALRNVINSGFPALYLFYGLGPGSEDPEVTDLVREAASRLAGRPGAVILTGDGAALVESLGSSAGVVRIPAPTREDFEKLLRQVVVRVSSRMKVDV